MNTHEGSRAEQQATYANYLEPLQQYLDETARTIAMQIAWLNAHKAHLPSRGFKIYDDEITAEIERNVNVAGAYIVGLAQRGMPIHLIVGDMRLPVEGLAYDPAELCYSAGVQLPEGEAMFPLNGTIALLDAPENS